MIVLKCTSLNVLHRIVWSYRQTVSPGGLTGLVEVLFFWAMTMARSSLKLLQYHVKYWQSTMKLSLYRPVRLAHKHRWLDMVCERTAWQGSAKNRYKNCMRCIVIKQMVSPVKVRIDISLHGTGTLTEKSIISSLTQSALLLVFEDLGWKLVVRG